MIASNDATRFYPQTSDKQSTVDTGWSVPVAMEGWRLHPLKVSIYTFWTVAGGASENIIFITSHGIVIETILGGK